MPHTAQNWKRCVNESTPWSPPPDLDVHALDLGIKTWDDSPGQVTAFSTTPGFLEQDMVQWTLYWTAPVWPFDPMTTITASIQYCLCQHWSLTREYSVDDPSRATSWHNPHSECFKQNTNQKPAGIFLMRTTNRRYEKTQSPESLVRGWGKCFLGETVGGSLLILQGLSR